MASAQESPPVYSSGLSRPAHFYGSGTSRSCDRFRIADNPRREPASGEKALPSEWSDTARLWKTAIAGCVHPTTLLMRRDSRRTQSLVSQRVRCLLDLVEDCCEVCAGDVGQGHVLGGSLIEMLAVIAAWLAAAEEISDSLPP